MSLGCEGERSKHVDRRVHVMKRQGAELPNPEAPSPELPSPAPIPLTAPRAGESEARATGPYRRKTESGRP